MSEEASRRQEALRKKLKKATDNIIKEAKKSVGKNLSTEEAVSIGASLEAEKKSEQLSAFLEKEVFERIEALEGRIQELENGLAEVTSATTTIP